jgi:DNA repair exonuclease SbcCD ATPase subunit
MSDLIQMTFDYSLLDEDKRVRVQVKTESIRVRLKRTAEDIIATGQDLIDVKKDLGHGLFQDWLKSEFDMSYPTANNFMNAAERFGDKTLNFRDLSVSVLYLLAAPSTPDTVIERVQSGEIPPTLEDIRKAKAELRQAKIAEAKAQADFQAAQQRLLNLQETSQSQIDDLTKQINDLEEEIKTITTPEIEIREIEKEVVPQSISLKLEKLQKQLEQLKTERKQQEERIQKLNTDLSVVIRKQAASENDDRIRQGWRQITGEAHACMMRLLGQWPTPLDVRAFEADDLARVDHLKATLQRVLEECNNLHYRGDDMIIEANGSPYALRVVE